MPSAKISALTALDSTANLAQLYIPLFKADGSPDNPRILASDLLLAADGVNITPAWSGTGTATTPLLVNVTADPGPANAASKLLDLQVGGTSRLVTTKDALTSITATAGVTGSLLSVTRTGELPLLDVSQFGVGTASRNVIVRGEGLAACPDGSSNKLALLGQYGIRVSSGLHFAWGSSATSIATTDLELYRDAADVLALRRGNSNQMLRVYEDYTNSTDNFSRGVFGWKLADGTTDSTVLRIGTEKGSLGGSARAVSIVTDGTERINIATNGNVALSTASTQFTAPYIVGSLGVYCRTNSSPGYFLGASDDVGLTRVAANILGITNGSTGGGAIEFTEMTAPATPAANQARVFARDNGSGKTQVCIILPDGVVTVLATQT